MVSLQGPGCTGIRQFLTNTRGNPSAHHSCTPGIAGGQSELAAESRQKQTHTHTHPVLLQDILPSNQNNSPKISRSGVTSLVLTLGKQICQIWLRGPPIRPLRNEQLCRGAICTFPTTFIRRFRAGSRSTLATHQCSTHAGQ